MALVLGRKNDESVVIGDDVLVTVVRCERGRYRLVIAAPKSVRVDRLENLPAAHPAWVAADALAARGE